MTVDRRRARVERKTRESDIVVELDLVDQEAQVVHLADVADQIEEVVQEESLGLSLSLIKK